MDVNTQESLHSEQNTAFSQFVDQAQGEALGGVPTPQKPQLQARTAQPRKVRNALLS